MLHQDSNRRLSSPLSSTALSRPDLGRKRQIGSNDVSNVKREHIAAGNYIIQINLLSFWLKLISYQRHVFCCVKQYFFIYHFATFLTKRYNYVCDSSFSCYLLKDRDVEIIKILVLLPELVREEPAAEDGPAAKRLKGGGSEEATEREVVIEEGPIVPDLVTPDEHLDDEDLDEDEDEDILSASQLLRRHRADEFEEEEFEEDYYWDVRIILKVRALCRDTRGQAS